LQLTRDTLTAMPAVPEIGVSLLPGARELLREHARALPQRDDFCGAFCGALALAAAGESGRGTTRELDQDAVAAAAGTTVSAIADTSALPHGESGRRDYRIEPALIDDAAASGTNCRGLVRALESLSRGRLAAIAYDGPWSAETIGALFDAALQLERPATLVANVATRHLWGANASVAEIVGYLLAGEDSAPPPDWDVGHFVCVPARVDGPGGALYALADTYPSLGARGLHVQPRERLALALARPGMAPGGVIAVVDAGDAESVRERALGAGLHEGIWDNGSIEHVREAA
jgi:hypothetical protein